MSNEAPEAPRSTSESAPLHPAFADLTAQQIKDLQVGPMNRGGIPEDLSHPFYQTVPEELLGEMRAYALNEPPMAPDDRIAQRKRIADELHTRAFAYYSALD